MICDGCEDDRKAFNLHFESLRVPGWGNLLHRTNHVPKKKHTHFLSTKTTLWQIFYSFCMAFVAFVFFSTFRIVWWIDILNRRFQIWADDQGQRTIEENKSRWNSNQLSVPFADDRDSETKEAITILTHPIHCEELLWNMSQHKNCPIKL